MNLNIKPLKIKKHGSHIINSLGIQKKIYFFIDNPNYKEKGEMQAFIKGHQLIRQNFYLSDKDGISNIKQVDEHEMILNLHMKTGTFSNIQDLLIQITIDIELYIHGIKMN